MATKRAGKGKASSGSKAVSKKSAAKRKSSPSAPLHEVIEQVIEATNSGDYAAGKRAVSALAAFSKSATSASQAQAAAEAHAVAHNPIPIDRARLLRDIAKRLKTHA